MSLLTGNIRNNPYNIKLNRFDTLWTIHGHFLLLRLTFNMLYKRRNQAASSEDSLLKHSFLQRMGNVLTFYCVCWNS